MQGEDDGRWGEFVIGDLIMVVVVVLRFQSSRGSGIEAK
jgi:hypothetical protein